MSQAAQREARPRYAPCLARTEKSGSRTGGLRLDRHASSVADAAGAADAENAHPLADAEDFIGLHFLHIGAPAAVVFPHGDFHALGAGKPLLGGRTDQPAGHRAYDRRHRAAAATAHAAAGHPADHRAGAGTDRRLGAFDLYRTQRLYGALAHGLHGTRLVPRIAVTAQAGLATRQADRKS